MGLVYFIVKQILLQIKVHLTASGRNVYRCRNVLKIYSCYVDHVCQLPFLLPDGGDRRHDETHHYTRQNYVDFSVTIMETFGNL